MKDKIAILYRKELKEYDFGPGHPFHGDRGGVVIKFLKEKLPKDSYQILKADWVKEEDLLLICQKDYLDFTKNYFRVTNLGESYNGRFYQYHSIDNLPIGRPGKIEEAARLIVGQTKLACDLVQKGKYKKVISIGGGLHHAKPSFGEGFCIYNDVAFCAKYLIEKYGLKRILILDTDAHAGNGTYEYFYQDPRVLFIDLHQDPRTLYPGTGFLNEIGVGEGRGLKINVPLAPGASDYSYKLVFEEIIEPVVREFNPQIIIRNGGSDPHFADLLANLGLTVNGFRMIGEKVREMAEICAGKEIDLIASGYNEKVLPYCFLALISGLIRVEIEIREPISLKLEKDSVIKETKGIIKEVKRNLKDYWKCFK